MAGAQHVVTVMKQHSLSPSKNRRACFLPGMVRRKLHENGFPALRKLNTLSVAYILKYYRFKMQVLSLIVTTTTANPYFRSILRELSIEASGSYPESDNTTASSRIKCSCSCQKYSGIFLDVVNG
jgi:hypothetical protein